MQMDMDAPLKAAPKLVAPEPGQYKPLQAITASSYFQALSDSPQSTAPVPNLSKPAKLTPALAAPTRTSAHLPPKVQTLISPQSTHA